MGEAREGQSDLLHLEFTTSIISGSTTCGIYNTRIKTKTKTKIEIEIETAVAVATTIHPMDTVPFPCVEDDGGGWMGLNPLVGPRHYRMDTVGTPVRSHPREIYLAGGHVILGDDGVEIRFPA